MSFSSVCLRDPYPILIKGRIPGRQSGNVRVDLTTDGPTKGQGTDIETLIRDHKEQSVGER